MDYGMIGKIEKAKRYAEERHRVTFNSLLVNVKGDNATYEITLGPDGWQCTCPGFQKFGICPHIMALERLFMPMLKRDRLPYAIGQNVVSDVEKAKRYSEEHDRIRIKSFDVIVKGNNGDHHSGFQDGKWTCDCSFFRSRGACSHTMAMERILKGMLDIPVTAQD